MSAQIADYEVTGEKIDGLVVHESGEGSGGNYQYQLKVKGAKEGELFQDGKWFFRQGCHCAVRLSAIGTDVVALSCIEALDMLSGSVQRRRVFVRNPGRMRARHRRTARVAVQQLHVRMSLTSSFAVCIFACSKVHPGLHLFALVKPAGDEEAGYGKIEKLQQPRGASSSKLLPRLAAWAQKALPKAKIGGVQDVGPAQIRSIIKNCKPRSVSH